MNLALPRMTLDEFLPWAEAQPREAGKLKLLDGVVIGQQSPRWAHSKTKHQMTLLLAAAIKQAGVPYFAAPEGPTVRIAGRTGFEPDASMALLPEPAPDSLEIPNPILVVEVLSPSTARIDMTTKLERYFEVESIEHYLIVDPEGATVIHHRRTAAGAIETPVIDDRSDLDPPGIVLRLGDIFGPAPTA